MKLSSSAFDDNGNIPVVYTCSGEDISPPLSIDDVPEGTMSLVLTLEDPDAARGTFDHWVIFNMPPQTRFVEEGIQTPGLKGANTIGKKEYIGPCPPSGTHRYVFTLYALDTMLDLRVGSTKSTILNAAKYHVIDKATLTGLFSK